MQPFSQRLGCICVCMCATALWPGGYASAVEHPWFCRCKCYVTIAVITSSWLTALTAGKTHYAATLSGSIAPLLHGSSRCFYIPIRLLSQLGVLWLFLHLPSRSVWFFVGGFLHWSSDRSDISIWIHFNWIFTLCEHWRLHSTLSVRRNDTNSNEARVHTQSGEMSPMVNIASKWWGGWYGGLKFVSPDSFQQSTKLGAVLTFH